MKLPGHFFRALSSKEEVGEIHLSKNRGSIISDGNFICLDVGILSIQRKKDIYLDNGFLFTLTEPLTYEQESFVSSKFKRGITWLENFSFTKAILLSIILILALIIFRLSLTSITTVVVSVFPQTWEKTVGRNTYLTLNKTIFKKSEIPLIKKEKIIKKAKQIASANGFESTEILFHKSDIVGANALAFPGGPIVITDDLVNLLKKDNLILGVIAHEFAHIEKRHSLHQIIEVIGLVTIASVLFGSNETLMEEASLIGLNIWMSKKSREFEKEADLIALEYLENAGLNKNNFSLAIEKLTRYVCSSNLTQSIQDCLENNENSWLSTHPSGAARLKYLSEH